MAFSLLDLAPTLLKGAGGSLLSYEGGQLQAAGADVEANSYISAGQSALAGGQFSAEVYRNSGKAALASAAYNQALDQATVNRTKDAVSREIGTLLSQNRVTQGASGLSLASGSYLAVTHASLSSMERKLININSDARQRQAQIGFEGQLAAMTAENQALSAEYQGKVTNVNDQNKASAAEYAGEESAYKANTTAIGNIGDLINSSYSSYKTSKI